MLWALLLIHGEGWWGAGMAGYLMTGVVATLMCVQARQQWLGYIPGTFAGCCATFGAAGEWRLILPSLVIGALFGYMMKASGLWLSSKTQATANAANPARS
ncbi:Inner membrane protein YcdZ [compost metagenome]